MSATKLDYSFTEVANHLNVAPETLQRINRRFADHLSPAALADEPHFDGADLTALLSIQKLLQQGYSDAQIVELLPASPIGVAGTASDLPTAADGKSLGPYDREGVLFKGVGDVLSTIANGQKAILNSQNTIREMIGAVVQDNFNLKDENRKLRERMLEMERALAEYQRREETRKERMESRMRALEGTVGALQQQVAQLVQLQRQQNRRRGWFG
ncbi:MAG: MerR family transcriptional regulator [Caldilineaceae bacterium]|nr:MerR family transcriptional regulator [Caldilineaceae bacterium]